MKPQRVSDGANGVWAVTYLRKPLTDDPHGGRYVIMLSGPLWAHGWAGSGMDVALDKLFHGEHDYFYQLPPQ